MQDIGNKIFKYRCEHNVTIREFARLSNLSAPTIVSIEKHRTRNIRAGTIGKIMHVINKGE